MRLFALTAAFLIVAAGCGTKTSKQGRHGRVLAVAQPPGDGRWTKLLLSPDGRTYLGQWSGECEIHVAYFVGADGGTPRAITNYTRGSAESIAIGWAGRRARVQLPRGQAPSRSPGVYLVDPRTMKMTLERPIAPARGC